MMEPIETSPIFINLRPRLFHKVPVLETLRFVKMFQNYEPFYSKIKFFVDNMVENAQRFFMDDIYELSVLKGRLDSGRYRISRRGRLILRMRLHLTYDDGIKYNVAANIVREIKIQPIVDLEPKILKSQETASTAKNLSKTIGEEMGINLDELHYA